MLESFNKENRIEKAKLDLDFSETLKTGEVYTRVKETIYNFLNKNKEITLPESSEELKIYKEVMGKVLDNDQEKYRDKEGLVSWAKLKEIFLETEKRLKAY